MAAAPSFTKRITALKKRLAEIQKRRSPRRFLPPYTAAELADVEAKLGVALPEEVRAFVTQVTQGEDDTGAPSLAPPHLGRMALGPDDDPAAPFPFGAEDAAAVLQKQKARKPSERGAALEATMNGLLPIMDHGDNDYDCVVLTGTQRGMMWKYWEDGVTPLEVTEKKQSRPVDYLTWVEAELKDALAAAPPPIDVRSKEITLSALALTEVPPEVLEASAVERLDLSNNRLSHLPDGIGKLGELRWLSVSVNQLHELPASIGELSHLQSLHATGNLLEALPDAIGRLAGLSQLALWGNKLRRLPSTLGGLGLLADLDVSDNALVELPETMGDLRSLRALKLAKNPLVRLPDSMARLPIEALDLEHLPELDLDAAVAVLARNPSLTALGIKHFGRAPAGLSALVHVKRLKLVGLGLSEVPPEVLSLPNLESLSLDQNQIEALPDELFAMPRLASIILFSNPIDKAYVAGLRARWPAVKITA